MLLNLIISNQVPIAAPSDNIDYINSLFFASKLCQIPIVENGIYLGLLDHKDAEALEAAREQITEKHYANFRLALTVNAHPFEVLRLMHLYQLSIIPIITEDGGQYVGAITKDGLLKYLVENMGIEAEGGIIVLEMDARDYSLSQIARICESEKVLILGAQVKAIEHSPKLTVTLKTNSTDLAAVVQSLERFRYTVVDTYGDRKIENDVVDRYKLLMNYINM